MYFNLEKLFELTKQAMADIDSDYWIKCIEHMKKEIHYYMEQDGLLTNQEEIKINEPEFISTMDHLLIPVSLMITII